MGKCLLVFFIDALGWEIIKKISFLDELKVEKGKLASTLGYSSAAQPTILTGLMPNEHGHWSMFLLANQTSIFKGLSYLEIIPSIIKDKSRFRRLVHRYLRYRYNISGYFDLYQIPFKILEKFDIIQKKNIFCSKAFENEYSIFDKLDQVNISYKSYYWDQDDESNFLRLNNDITSNRASFYFYYTACLDAMLHQYGGVNERIRKRIVYYENEIKKAYYNAKKVYNSVDLIVFSDHGMCEVKEYHDLQAEIESLEYNIIEDYLPFYDSTMARFWYKNERAKSAISGKLKELSFGKCLSKEELIKYSIYFKDNRYGELIFLLNPGHLILPSYMGKYPVKGMHGFAPEHKDSYAFYLTNFMTGMKMLDIKNIFVLLKMKIQH